MNGGGAAPELVARVLVEAIDDHRQGLREVDAVLAHLEPDGKEREPEPQGAIPGLAKLLVVVVH